MNSFALTSNSPTPGQFHSRNLFAGTFTSTLAAVSTLATKPITTNRSHDEVIEIEPWLGIGSVRSQVTSQWREGMRSARLSFPYPWEDRSHSFGDRSRVHRCARKYLTQRLIKMASAALFGCWLICGQTPGGNMSTRGQSAHVNKFDTGSGTVVVGVAIAEGLVLAADSRLTMTFDRLTPPYKTISDSAQKLFDVGNAGLAMYGSAFLQGRSVAAWVGEFKSQSRISEARTLASSPFRDIEVMAKEFSAYMSPIYDKQFPPGGQRPILGFMMIGYNKAGVGKLIQFELPSSPVPQTTHDTTNTGLEWGGHTHVISRLLLGVNDSMREIPELKLTPQQQKLYSDKIDRQEFYIPYPSLMLQDGIDLALSLVRITVEIERFSFGTNEAPGEIPGVGGAVDVLIVTPSGVQWVKQKALSAN
jgi:hypothetical protein